MAEHPEPLQDLWIDGRVYRVPAPVVAHCKFLMASRRLRASLARVDGPADPEAEPLPLFAGAPA